MKTVKVRFLKTYTVQAVGGAVYQDGSVHELREDSAAHFISRGAAEAFDDSGRLAPNVAPNPQPLPGNERELTTSVDLGSLYAKIRQREGIEPSEGPKSTSSGEKTNESSPIVPSGIQRDDLARGIGAGVGEAHGNGVDKGEIGGTDPEIGGTSSNALISCIMPTWNRRPFIRAAIDCWIKQSYKNKELIILDDGDGPIKDLIPTNRRLRIRYVRIDKRESTGQKRNHCCELARGEIICHFDDDDWSAPDRIQNQVDALMQSGKPITGYGTILFWDVLTEEVKRYISIWPGYVVGTSLCYLKSYWQKHLFPDIQEMSDNGFIYPAVKQIACSHDAKHMVARIHDCHHTSPKKGIAEIVSRDIVPEAFWENEHLRLA